MIAVEAPARRGISSFPALNQPCALPGGQKIRRFYCVSFFFPPFSLVPKGGKIRLHIIIRWKFGEDERAKFRIERERRRLFVEKSNRFALYVRFLRFWLIASEADVAEINWWIKRRGLKLIRGGKYSYVEVHIGIMESAWKVLETSSLDKLSCETRFSRVCAATCAVCIRRSWLSTNRVRPPTNVHPVANHPPISRFPILSFEGIDCRLLNGKEVILKIVFIEIKILRGLSFKRRKKLYDK